MRDWVYLLIAGLMEVGWAIGLKYTQGWTRLWPSVLTGLGMVASYYFLAKAMHSIPIGTGYAIWTGIGAFGTAVLGIALLGEPATPARLICLALILSGIIGLMFSSP